MRERLKAEPHPVLQKYLFGPGIARDVVLSFYNMSEMNLAHALMLAKQGIISLAEARLILRELIALRDKGPEAFTPNSAYEDYYMNIENYLIERLGVEYAGKLHTARSRNDLHSTVDRMNVRDSYLKLLELLLSLRKVILTLAAKYKETVFTGYTHMQPAQPITLGHYFLAVAEALERDFQRFETAWIRINLSTLGSCAFAGTSFPIDREYTAGLMGFDGNIVNTIDAVASRDYLLELTADYAILGSTLSRLSNDLYYWATDEFGYIEIDDSMAASSSIMPQKKNPTSLEHIKAKSAHLIAAFVSVAGCLKNIP
jgi:argininosuccinate lyase